jgi:DNA-binding MarR family transcriptional regulator
VIVYGGPQTTSELARREGVSGPTVTRIVDALVREGLVRREGDAGDRRVVRLSATGSGRELMERARARRIQRLGRELDALASADLGRLEQAVDVLLKLEKEDRR